MIQIQQVGLLYLASGLSRRFGTENKLMHPLFGQPLAQHSAKVLAAIGFQNHVAVCTPDSGGPGRLLSASGFTIVENHDAVSGQSASITLGLQGILARQPQAVLIALADMPFVSAAHIFRLIAQCSAGTAGIAASAKSDGSRSPPAIFTARHFDALQHLEGDTGARALIRDGDPVLAPDRELTDIDTEADFVHWEADGCS